MGTTSGWTPERRAKQAEAIRRNQPWLKSTGPRTAEGKAISSRNADRGGYRRLARARQSMMRARLKLLAHLIARDGIKPLGPPGQVGRRPRSVRAAARYEEELAWLEQEADRLRAQLDLLAAETAPPRERPVPFP